MERDNVFLFFREEDCEAERRYKYKYLLISDESENADEEIENEKLVVDGFCGDGANNGQGFRSEEVRQAGSNFDQRFHVLGDQKRFEKSEG